MMRQVLSRCIQSLELSHHSRLIRLQHRQQQKKGEPEVLQLSLQRDMRSAEPPWNPKPVQKLAEGLQLHRKRISLFNPTMKSSPKPRPRLVRGRRCCHGCGCR